MIFATSALYVFVFKIAFFRVLAFSRINAAISCAFSTVYISLSPVRSSTSIVDQTSKRNIMNHEPRSKPINVYTPIEITTVLNNAHANSTVLNILEFSYPLLQQSLNLLLARLNSRFGLCMVCIRSVRSERPLVITTRSIRELPINPSPKQ